MIVEKLTVTSTNLNSGTDQELPIAKVSIPDGSGITDSNRHYRVSSIRIANTSGEAIYVIFFNDLEKAEYDDSNPLFADKFEMDNGVSEVFPISRTITNIIVAGTSGSGHTASLDIYVVKE